MLPPYTAHNSHVSLGEASHYLNVRENTCSQRQTRTVQVSQNKIVNQFNKEREKAPI